MADGEDDSEMLVVIWESDIDGVIDGLFRNYYKIVEALGPEYTSPLIYKFWLKEFSEKKNNKIIKKLNSYLNSNNYRFEYYN